MELYIIRHGQSANNAVGEDQHLRVQDPELTAIGHRQAQHVADFLQHGINLERLVLIPPETPERDQPQAFGLTHLYCSAMHRALQTAQPIGTALGLPPHVWLDIHEHGGIYLDQPDGGVVGYGGRTRSQVMAEFDGYVLPDALTETGWWDVQRGREDMPDAQARAIRVAGELRRRALADSTAADRVALVTHGTFIDALIKALLHNLPSDRYFHWHYNCAITRIDLLTDGRLIIRYINRVTHLPSALITT